MNKMEQQGFQSGYIYVLKGSSGGGALVGQNTSILSQVTQCPEGYDVHMMARVNDAVEVERLVVAQLKTCKTITHRPGIEKYEFFNGNIGTITSIVTRTVAELQQYEDEDNDTVENPLVSFMDMLTSSH